MAESQNIEYKESWRDEYLKWVCGFANAQGGTIYIGIDDTGNVVGMKNIKKLLEDIPNKIRQGLGIVADGQLIISNQCIFPESWTVETLMEPHDSVPYNPDIANVFYRAGYIEHWGRGIEKIIDECKALGAEPPRYELLGHGLRVFFKALESALIDQLEEPKCQSAKADGALDDTLALRIIELIRNKPDITLDQLSAATGIARRTLVRHISDLKESGRIERVGGKRYGHWEIKE